MIMAHHGHKLGYSALRSSAPMPTPTMVSYGMRLGRRQSELGELGVTEIGRPADDFKLQFLALSKSNKYLDK